MDAAHKKWLMAERRMLKKTFSTNREELGMKEGLGQHEGSKVGTRILPIP